MKILRSKWRNAHASFRALGILAREETSFQMQIFSACVTLVVSYFLRISNQEWLIITLIIGMVLATEAINTAIEELCDHVTPAEHVTIAKIKDLAAAAVGIIQIAALIIGCAIFIPRLLALL
jgi:diacylglycerol kinase